jgi:uncharacterized protein YecE (DUF72 family)
VTNLERISIGTSGFSYKDWLGNFYPQFCPLADFLRFYASRFRTVEIDSTFYRIPTETTVLKWAENTSDGFKFAAKFPRTVTHEGSLAGRIDSAHRFVEVMRLLGDKLGPLLLQFPYDFMAEQTLLLTELISSLPADLQVSVELRHRGWLDNDAIFDCFRERNIAFCLIDHPWMPRSKIATADFVYVRLLGDRNKIESDFSYVRFDREKDLVWWHELVREYADQGKDVYVYLNNHYTGHSPTSACRLLAMLGSDHTMESNK